ncbi:MAG: stage V sporulation protein AE [Clostridiales bacterium 43-6]|nr:MAG: stage V sporulation protein AE [Clostridiales bacterium 43-6]
MEYFYAFVVGGLICVVGQLLIDFTKLTPARILVAFVTAGVILTAIGVYEPLVELAGAGATVPLTGFGYALAKGVEKAVAEFGLIGVITGGVIATAGGITAAIVFGYLTALVSKPGDKS